MLSLKSDVNTDMKIDIVYMLTLTSDVDIDYDERLCPPEPWSIFPSPESLELESEMFFRQLWS